MSDLVQRLRHKHSDRDGEAHDLAADEIERLTAENAALRADKIALHEINQAQAQQILELCLDKDALRERVAESEHHRTKNRETAVRYQARLSAAEALIQYVRTKLAQGQPRNAAAAIDNFLTPADQPTVVAK